MKKKQVFMQDQKTEINSEAATKVVCKKRFSKNNANFTAKHLCWSLFLINLQAFRPGTPRTPILKNICKRHCFFQFSVDRNDEDDEAHAYKLILVFQGKEN